MAFSGFQQIGHVTVAAMLRQEIFDGRLAPGAELPAEADLAFRFGCGRDTVRAALQVLRRELLIVSARGYRSRIAPVANRRPVVLAAGAAVVARMPYEFELAGLRCRAEMPLLEVSVPDGAVALHPADEVTLVCP
ncbi:winged helix-turn-helix domain-containing protein [Dactylosporangium sp. NPDC000244]|uniref:winged helix-turn-helix domain-containing protein n=1 Tax=Dactylosporangium sp. NPDC000244 TaxID=3154365 RepID=UPI00331E92B8